MASTFVGQFQGTAAAQLLKLHGRTATWYLGGSGAGTSVTVIWTPGSVEDRYGPSDRKIVAQGTAKGLPATFSGWTVSDTFAIDGETYAVSGVARTEPLVEFQLVQYERTSIGRDTGRISQ